MSIAVTIRPRRLSTPATSAEASGTRVSRSGMNTSCTREIGRPNSCPPIMVVTYSVMLAAAPASFALICQFLCGAVEFGSLFFQRGDQARPVELGDIVVESRLASALDRRRVHH